LKSGVIKLQCKWCTMKILNSVVQCVTAAKLNKEVLKDLESETPPEAAEIIKSNIREKGKASEASYEDSPQHDRS
jgi:hypothetical protein